MPIVNTQNLSLLSCVIEALITWLHAGEWNRVLADKLIPNEIIVKHREPHQS